LDALFAMAYEVVFVLLCWLIWNGLEQSVLLIKSGSFDPLPLDKAAMIADPSLIDSASAGLTMIAVKLGAVFLSAGIIFILLYCLFNALIWAKLGGRKAETAWMKRWMRATVPWTMMWGIIFILTTILFKPESYWLTVPIWFFAAIYFTTALHLVLATDNESRGWAAMKKSLNLAIPKGLSIIIPGVLWLAVYLAITFLVGLAIDMTRNEIIVPYLIVMTVWLRSYLFRNVERSRPTQHSLA